MKVIYSVIFIILIHFGAASESFWGNKGNKGVKVSGVYVYKGNNCPFTTKLISLYE